MSATEIVLPIESVEQALQMGLLSRSDWALVNETTGDELQVLPDQPAVGFVTLIARRPDALEGA